MTFMSVYSTVDPAKLQLPSLYPKWWFKFEPWKVIGEQMVHESCMVFLSTESFFISSGLNTLHVTGAQETFIELRIWDIIWNDLNKIHNSLSGTYEEFCYSFHSYELKHLELLELLELAALETWERVSLHSLSYISGCASCEWCNYICKGLLEFKKTKFKKTSSGRS